jgi:hypothetical protein
MISQVALSLISLYPWNFGVSGYLTLGKYSTNRNYQSKQVVVYIDRRGKDLLLLNYEHLNIKDDLGDFKQENIIFRNVLWFRPELRMGSIAGLVHSNSIDKGWIIGCQGEGDLPWLGYSIDYTYLEFQGWEPQPVVWNIIDYPITQLGFGVSRKFYSFIFRFHSTKQHISGNDYFLFSSRIICGLIKDFTFALRGSVGKSRYALDPYLLIMDNNPDILKQLYGIYIGYQVTPNISISGEALRKEYSPAFNLQNYNAYHVKYIVFGIQLRL